MTSSERAWQRYRWGKRGLWLGFLLYLPVVVGLSYLLERLGYSGAAPYVAIGWLVLWGVNGVWLATFRCPACSKRFFMWSHSAMAVGNVWATACHHCCARPPTRLTT